jgi:putative tricarboxylic transport membrane protein
MIVMARGSMVLRIGVLLLGLFLVSACAMPGSTSGGAPQRPVEFVVTTNPGGGSDVYARFIIGIIEKNKLSPQPFVVVNKAGGAGAVAMQYVFEKKGDPHAVLITLNSVFTTPQLQKLPFKSISDDFTSVALMALDPFFLWTYNDAWKTWEEFLADAKTNEVTVSGTGSKQEDEILFALLVKHLGLKPFKYVPGSGGGEVAAQLAGKHVQATVNQPSEAAPHYPDRVRPLLAFTPDRMKQYPDVRTYKDVGLSNIKQLEYYQVRGIVAAPGITAAQQKWLTDLFKKVFETKEWKDFLDSNLMTPKFLGGDDFKKFLKEYDVLHADLMKGLGWTQ